MLPVELYEIASNTRREKPLTEKVAVKNRDGFLKGSVVKVGAILPPLFELLDLALPTQYEEMLTRCCTG